MGEGACALETLVFWGVNGVPLGADPNPRLGLGRGPPGRWSRGYSLGNSKKGKKINTCFGTVFKLGFITLEP